MFYTYLWLREDGTPYYAGKGKGNRGFESRGHRVHCPPLERIIIQEWVSETEAFEAEKFLILYYGRKDLGTGYLVNLSDGGEGVSGSIAVSERMKRLNSDPEFRRKQLANIDPTYPWNRLSKTPEVRKHMSETMMGRKFSNIHCQHLSEGKRGIPSSLKGIPIKSHCRRGHPRPISDVGKSCRQCESLRWGKKWGKIQGTPEYFARLSTATKEKNHIRWHVNRHLMSKVCKFCQEGLNVTAENFARGA
jgi:hypothetical protein